MTETEKQELNLEQAITELVNTIWDYQPNKNKGHNIIKEWLSTNHLAQLDKTKCYYCSKKPDGAMLTMGNSFAHANCVIRKLNELLDPDYDGSGAAKCWSQEVVKYFVSRRTQEGKK